MATTAFDVQAARQAFPALLAGGQIYFDNAGGSQVLGSVSQQIKAYLEESNVQLGASYDVAKQSTAAYNAGIAAAAAFVNAEPDDIVIGASTTQLFANLSLILSLPPNSEIIISQIDHETNISPWLRLARMQNHTVKWWRPDTSTSSDLLLTAANLQPLLSPKTRLVTCTHTSNVLGGIHDIKSIAAAVHQVPSALLCVDGVAFAPHREVNVKDLDVDFYSFSWYKVYGPHIALLYASPRIRHQLGSLGHYFHAGDSLTTKLGLAAASYELVAALPSVLNYFSKADSENISTKARTWANVATHEETLQRIILDFLKARKDVVVHGIKDADQRRRVPVISFSALGRSSKDVVELVERQSRIGFRWGHFYSKRLVDEILQIKGESDGVIRVSLVHYNTEEEVAEFLNVLERVLNKTSNLAEMT